MVKVTEKLLEEYFNELKNQIYLLKEENREIKERLEEINSGMVIVQIRDIPDEEIESIIIQYLKDNKGKEIYPSVISFEFNLEAKKVFEIAERMKKEGRLS